MMPATVLVVDDEPSIRALVIRALTEAGYHAIEAHDGREAWRLLRHGDSPIDMVVSDVAMPHMTGTELAALIRDELPHIPVILVSSYNPADLRARGIDPPAEFVSKPFDPDDLVRHVRAALRDAPPPAD